MTSRLSQLDRAGEQLLLSNPARRSENPDSPPAYIALLDRNGIVVSVNEPWRAFGRSSGFCGSDFCIGINYIETCLQSGGDRPGEAKAVAAGIASVLEGRSDRFSLEYPCHFPTEQCWFQTTATPLTGQATGGIVVMHFDITEKIRGQEAEHRFVAAINSIDDAITLVSRNTLRFVQFNAATSTLVGYATAELFERGPAKMAAFSEDELARLYDDIIASPTRSDRRTRRLTRKDGTVVEVEVRSKARRFQDDWVITSVFRDITERKLGEQRLIESERRFSEMLGTIELISLMVDCEARITYCNPYLLTLSGHRAEDIIGHDWFEVLGAPESGDPPTRRFSRILAGDPAAMHGESEILLASGERRLIRWNHTLLRSELGDVIGTASIGEDITESRHAEAKIVFLNRVKAVVSAINQLIVHVEDRQQLFEGACQTAIKEAGFRMAIVGIVDEDAQKIFPVASAGETEAVREALLGTLTTGELDSKSMVARAIRTKEPVMSAYSQADPEVSCGTRYTELQVGSKVILPLVVGDTAVGAFALYAREANFFQKEEMSLLLELAANIAFAIDVIDRKKRLARLSRTRAVSTEINSAIVRIRKREDLAREACRIVVATGGYRTAWIGFTDWVAMKIVPMALAGDDPELLTILKDRFSLDARLPFGNTLNARAVRQRKPMFVNDIREGAATPFSQERIDRGVRSIGVLPLVVDNTAFGVFNWYSDEVGVFDAEELTLLSEISDNVALALDNILKGERLEYLAYHDSLTGLANRILFLDRLEKCVALARTGNYELAVCSIDLERFKNINDSLGQAAGDSLLVQVAQWLRANSTDKEVIGRLDADHFACVIPKIPPGEDVGKLMAKLMDLFLRQPFHLNHAVFRISAKVGIARYPLHGGDAATLFKHAEAAVKNAKISRARFLFYDPKMDKRLEGRPALEDKLRQALDNEEFVIHYQPKLNIAKHAITGFEALLRWHDPDAGLVAPAQFISVLEETGLILEVGRWVLRQAIDQYLSWKDRGLVALPIAVNVSSLQLRDPDFFDEIRERIDRDPRVAAGLQLEITESLMMDDVSQSIASLESIRGMGLHIAMDDFGTGFSSLSYLAKLPIDTLKIDRSFVSEMSNSEEGLALVATTINLAHSMRLCVVAEGVETEMQLQQLRDLGCDEMQGFLFCKPIAVDVLEREFLVP
jgi:diguanylate cyclase (GGDEF)-like protein/PAS domain S-box-containing protein